MKVLRYLNGPQEGAKEFLEEWPQARLRFRGRAMPNGDRFVDAYEVVKHKDGFAAKWLETREAYEGEQL
jgi:hypothetical protein